MFLFLPMSCMPDMTPTPLSADVVPSPHAGKIIKMVFLKMRNLL